MQLPAGKYQYVDPAGPAHKRQSHCQMEAHVHWTDLVSHAPEGEWAKMAPFRILSTDIECAGRKVRLSDWLSCFLDCRLLNVDWTGMRLSASFDGQ